MATGLLCDVSWAQPMVALVDLAVWRESLVARVFPPGGDTGHLIGPVADTPGTGHGRTELSMTASQQ